MILGSIGIYYGYIDPTYKSTRSLQIQKQQFDAAVNNANELTQKRKTLVAQVNSFSSDGMLRLSKLVPDYIDNVRLIMEINQIALKYGMSLREVHVGGVSAFQGSQTDIVGSGSKNYDSVTLSFSVLTTYSTFKQFLGELENNLRITDIEKIVFTIPSGPKSDEFYQFSVSLKTYSLK